MQDALIACKNCGNQFTGKFCNNCGEKVYTEHDKTFAHFIEESFHFITHIDSKFLRTWWLVMTRPAVVSTDISQGVRKRYYKPINLFLIGVVLYLLFPFFPGLNMPLRTHRQQLHGQVADWMIQKKIDNKHLTVYQVAEKFDHLSPKIAKVMLLIIIPLSALVLQWLFRKYWFYFDHITLASEINTFYLFLTFFVVPLVYELILLITRLFNKNAFFDIGDAITVPIYLFVFGSYCTRAFRRFYREKRSLAILKSVLFLIGHGLIVYIIYRFILMCVVFLFI